MGRGIPILEPGEPSIRRTAAGPLPVERVRRLEALLWSMVAVSLVIVGVSLCLYWGGRLLVAGQSDGRHLAVGLALVPTSVLAMGSACSSRGHRSPDLVQGTIGLLATTVLAIISSAIVGGVTNDSGTTLVVILGIAYVMAFLYAHEARWRSLDSEARRHRERAYERARV